MMVPESLRMGKCLEITVSIQFLMAGDEVREPTYLLGVVPSHQDDITCLESGIPS